MLLVVGNFKRRTRAWRAQEETQRILEAIGCAPGIEEFLSAGAMARVVRVRMQSWKWVTKAVTAIRNAEVFTKAAEGRLWGARAKTPKEQERVGPVARGVRSLKELFEEQRSTLDAEGSYQRGEEGIFVTANDWRTEAKLLRRSEAGVWEVHEGTLRRLGISLGPAERLASLL